MIRRALISVSDKTGLIELGNALKHFQVEIISTGGTARYLQEAKIDCTEVSDYTGFPEMMEGRIKTLHPRVHGGLLGRRDDPVHEEAAKNYGIKWIDLVVVNLYPFEKAAHATKKPKWKDLIENIDIGGPTMIRAAAKNHEYVSVLVDPLDYAKFIQKLKENPNEGFDEEFRYKMATKAFAHTALYDSLIAETLSHYTLQNKELHRNNFPYYHFMHGKIKNELRYGENPHQKAAIYGLEYPREKSPLSNSQQGKALSFNNLLDADSAWKTIVELPPQSTVIIKHNNPCGVGLGKNLHESYDRALNADPESAFGGIVALSGEVDATLAEKMSSHFFEIICAESYSVEAREVLQKKKNLRVILLPEIQTAMKEYGGQIDVRKIAGSYLVQESDDLGTYSDYVLGPDVTCVTKRQPTDQELQGLRLAWVVSKNIKSNGIVIANEFQTLGIGCGQVNRRFASEGAALRAKEFDSKIRVCASDAFFPFADNIKVLQDAKVTAIVQPGGSKRDQEVTDACDAYEIAMLHTKTRHFKH